MQAKAQEEGGTPETVHVKHMGAVQLLVAAAGYHFLATR